MRRLPVVVAAVALAFGARGSASPPPLDQALQGVLEEQRQKLHIAGLAFVVVKGDEVVALRALGLRDVASSAAATPDTLFPVGSCTKAFTALAAAVAQDEGLLTLDDRPHRYLPYFKMADAEADALVTLRDMLSHRTGLRAYADLAAEPGVLTREEYVRAATGAKPVAPFRAKFQYSNAMYVAAGEAMAAAGRTTWEAAIERRLLTPLGMTHSVASARQVAAAADHATGYRFDAATGWTAVPLPGSLDALAPAGSVASTARDMGRWLRFLIGKGRFDGRQVVSERGWRDVTTAHMTMSPTLSYALGWALYDWNGHRVVEHNGGSEGISALVSFMPEEKVGFALLANSSPTTLTKIGEAGKLLWPILLEGAAPVASPAPDPVVSPATLPASEAASAPSPATLPTVDELLLRMTAAAGGELNIRRHATMEAVYEKHYLNQGVDAELIVRAKAPDLRAEDETWSAVGKRIGEVHIRYDGSVGGQETTFGQDSIYDGRELDDLRRRARLFGLLEMKRTYERLIVRPGAPLNGEEVVVLAARTGVRTDMFHVSTRTYLVLKTEKGVEVATYSDFRNVDGIVLAHAIHVQDVLGEITLTLRSVRFDLPLAGEVFKLKSQPAAAAKRAS